MAGKTEKEAVQNYLDFLQKAASCVTKAVFRVSGGYYASDEPHSLTLGDGLPQKLPRTNLFITVTQRYHVVQDSTPDRGPWRVTTTEYFYTLWRARGGRGKKPERLVSYQWHPKPGETYTYPHVHLGPASGVEPHLQKTHVPTGRVALEDVIRYAISQLGARPLRADWMEVLEDTQRHFEDLQTWSGLGIKR